MQASRWAVVWVVVLLGAPGTAAADLRAWVVARPALAGAGVPFTTGPIQVRLGDEVELAVVIRDDAGALRGDPARVRIGSRRLAVATAGGLPAGAEVTWLRVEPRMEHVDLPPPTRFPVFSNNVLTGPQHGRWLGYDTLEYETHALEEAPGIAIRGGRPSLRAAHSRRLERDRFGGAGSIWIAAQVRLANGTVLRTADASHVDRLGLAPAVMRVGFRSGDDYLGWLSTYFQTPNVFGSNGRGGDHQTDRYVGADCADVLVGALRAAGRREVQYTSVSGIGRYADPVSGTLYVGDDGLVRDAETRAPVALRWGAEVRPGDMITIDYADDAANNLPRAWDHIGALVRDAETGARGVLDAADIVRHMTHQGLDDQPIALQTPIRIRVWRWRASLH